MGNHKKTSTVTKADQQSPHLRSIPPHTKLHKICKFDDNMKNKSTHLTIIAPDTGHLRDISKSISFRTDVSFHFIRLLLWQKLALFFLRQVHPAIFTRAFLYFQKIKAEKNQILCFFDNPHLQYFDKECLSRFSRSAHLHYWNPVTKTRRISQEKKLFASISSFSASDCKTYGLTHVHQFYKHMQNNYTINQEENSGLAVFFGRPKGGREKRLTRLIAVLALNDVKYSIYLTGRLKTKELKKFRAPEIEYTEICRRIKGSKYIIDLPHLSGGFSLRTMEAIFYGKSIIADLNYNFDDVKACQLNQFFEMRNVSFGDIYHLAPHENVDPILYNKTFSINHFVDKVFSLVSI